MNLFKKIGAVFGAIAVAATMMTVTASAALTANDPETQIVVIKRKNDVASAAKGVAREKLPEDGGDGTEWASATAVEESTVYVLDKTYACYGVAFTGSSTTGYTEFEIMYDPDTFNSLDPDEQQKANEEVINTINDWNMSQEARAQVQKKFTDAEELGMTDSQLLTLMFAETKADLSTAMKWFGPFQGTVGLILGIGVVIIMVLLIASTVFDLVYIGLPMARNALDGKAESNGQPKPFGVSYDAVKVVQNHEGGGQGGQGGSNGNIYFDYLKRRVITYIILAVCILYLISGQLSSVIGWLLDLVSGVG